MTAAADRIAVGVAGWSYPDWDGYVYPRGLKDKLTFLAPYFDCIEINSTFYRPPDARTTESWAKKTAALPAFFFTAKLHQDITHGARVEPGMVKAFTDGMMPLKDSGKIRQLLAQFSYSFCDSGTNRTHLQKIRDSFSGIAGITLELRHSSWQTDEAAEFLHTLDVSVANLDYPVGRESYNPKVSGIGENGYLRLHGRNYESWFSKGAGRDNVYNYLYKPPEVDQIGKRAMEILSMSKTLTVIANNHYQGKEAVNALQIKALLTGSKVAVPPLLAERYPELNAISKDPPRTLI